MAKPYRLQQAGTFFITTSCWERRRLFTVERNARLFLDILLRHRPHYRLHAFVIMPDHLHMLITPRDIALERAIQLVKGGFSHAFGLASGRRLGVWERGFADHRIRNLGEYEHYESYIQQNPVVARLVEAPEMYPWSSAAGNVVLDPFHIIG